MRKIKKYKVGMDSETFAISLVEEPAIEENFIAMKKDEEKVVFMSSEEKHMLYGAVLVPDLDIYRYDGENEYYITFTKDSIEKMSRDFMKEYRQNSITLDHDTDATEITIVESWLKADLLRDKSVALGLNETLPVGTWFIGMHVNNIETWERVRSGELNGFSVESLIRLEDFNKIKEKDDIMEVNETFWDRMKSVLSDALSVLSMQKREENEVEQVEETVELEEQAPETINEPETTVEEPVETAPEPVNEPEPAPVPEEPKEAVKQPENKPEEHPNPLEDVVKNLQDEIKALKEKNELLEGEKNTLSKKIDEMATQPSVKPTNVNGNGTGSDSFKNWRNQMKNMLG